MKGSGLDAFVGIVMLFSGMWMMHGLAVALCTAGGLLILSEIGFSLLAYLDGGKK